MIIIKQIIVDISDKFTKTALLTDGKLTELIIDNTEQESIVGNIYAGIVKNILPSRFAFIDIGLEKNAFMFLDDNKESGLYDGDKLTLKQGQTLLFQVLKDPNGTKGAYVTSRLSFTGRYLVITETAWQTSNQPFNIGVSKRISDTEERQRLKNLFLNRMRNGFEIIIRTNAAGKSDDVLLAEFDELSQKTDKNISEWNYALAPCLVYKESDTLKKTVLDLYNDEINEIVINSEYYFNILKTALTGVSASATERLRLYADEIPIFLNYAVESQIDKALNKKVWLKSGGFLIIEQTEACAVIDVNTGKYSGKGSHEETVLKVNLEAAAAIAEQLRLRNLGGIIIVDFIDMKNPKNIELVTSVLTEETKKDRITVNVIGMTELGIMQLTRKKIKKPLSSVYNEINK